MQDPKSIIAKLEQRKQENNLRSLFTPEGLIDFSSNDYLGLARSAELKQRTEELYIEHFHARSGSGGSRLLSGNTAFAEALEDNIAIWHEAEASLIFNSGYDANVGLLSSVAGRHDTILYDELAHASIKDGARLSTARHFSFRHNDVAHLEQKISAAGGDVYVVTESIYSMDGDEAPLMEIAALKTKYPHIYIIVDEAHANGIAGRDGKGLCCQPGIREHIFARLYTFGKALGCHGAAMAGSHTLRNFLINYARPFIYSTALPGHALSSIAAACELIPNLHQERRQLQDNINYFRNAIGHLSHLKLAGSRSPIQGVIIPGNENVKKTARLLEQNGLDVRPILNPTVKAGTERLRVSLHAYNTYAEIDMLVNVLSELS